MAVPAFGPKVIVITQALTYTTATAEDRNNPISGGPLWVDHIRWRGATTAGHTAVITDKNDDPITTLVANAANYDVTINFSEGARYWREGFKVPTLGSGTLEFHLA